MDRSQIFLYLMILVGLLYSLLLSRRERKKPKPLYRPYREYYRIWNPGEEQRRCER